MYDAVVIGAGPAGSTCALELARAGWRVAIVEKAEFPRRKVCGEFVSAPGRSLLERAVAAASLSAAGPEIREVAIYAGQRIVTGAMPPAAGPIAYGRALGRDRLDTALLTAARDAGAEVWQPWRVSRYMRLGDRCICRIEQKTASRHEMLEARIVIAAHGSWDTGRIEPARAERAPAGSDLLAFKARFIGSALAPSVMPLVAFPGGYGGLVTSDSNEVSFSCCITRDALRRCRSASPGAGAGDAVLAHVLDACRGMRDALAGAERSGAWLAAGPLRPGFHANNGDRVFTIGNAHAEAHPIVAEGISMAIQSGALLAENLIAATPACASWDAVARSYGSAYRKNFRGRVLASAAFARIAMRPAAAIAAATLMQRVPALLALGARWAGKSAPLHAKA